MEKENRAARDRARYEYNNTVSQIASFAKRRDPRFKEFQRIAAERREVNEIEQREAVKREKEKRQVDALGYVEPEWSRPKREVDERDLYREHASSGSDVSSGDGFIVREENDDYWCIACNAIFKNKNQVRRASNGSLPITNRPANISRLSMH
jgi:DnaJ family protein A protein 5